VFLRSVQFVDYEENTKRRDLNPSKMFLKSKSEKEAQKPRIICWDSLALHAPVVAVVPCGHCSHKRCFDDWKAERGKRYRSAPRKWNAQSLFSPMKVVPTITSRMGIPIPDYQNHDNGGGRFLPSSSVFY
jgi:hypothetical protein